MRRGRKQRLTLAEHQVLGRELYELRRRIDRLASIGNYRRVPARIVDRLLRVGTRLDAVRSALEELLFLEQPGLPRSVRGLPYEERDLTRLYYPGGDPVDEPASRLRDGPVSRDGNLVHAPDCMLDEDCTCDAGLLPVVGGRLREGG
jgi:hypothetical protein